MWMSIMDGIQILEFWYYAVMCHVNIKFKIIFKSHMRMSMLIDCPEKKIQLDFHFTYFTLIGFPLLLTYFIFFNWVNFLYSHPFFIFPHHSSKGHFYIIPLSLIVSSRCHTFIFITYSLRISYRSTFSLSHISILLSLVA